MRVYEARVDELHLDPSGEVAAWIACPPAAAPGPGQYAAAYAAADETAALRTILFASQRGPRGFLSAAPVPSTWQPGTLIELSGPLGSGFNLPGLVRRLALVTLGNSLSRLLPLMDLALEGGCAVAVFTGARLPSLPPLVEAGPLSALPDVLGWADFLAFDLSPQELPGLKNILGTSRLPCPAQALLVTPMPCWGNGECGACAVQAWRGWKLACTDGPVFNLDDLQWMD